MRPTRAADYLPAVVPRGVRRPGRAGHRTLLPVVLRRARALRPAGGRHGRRQSLPHARAQHAAHAPRRQLRIRVPPAPARGLRGDRLRRTSTTERRRHSTRAARPTRAGIADVAAPAPRRTARERRPADFLSGVHPDPRRTCICISTGWCRVERDVPVAGRLGRVARLAQAIAETEAAEAALHAAEYGKWKGFYTAGDWLVDTARTMALERAYLDQLQGRPVSQNAIERAKDTGFAYVAITAYQGTQTVH